jgi:drug/metabolite transporter (DMT)-like permease
MTKSIKIVGQLLGILGAISLIVSRYVSKKDYDEDIRTFFSISGFSFVIVGAALMLLHAYKSKDKGAIRQLFLIAVILIVLVLLSLLFL